MEAASPQEGVNNFLMSRAKTVCLTFRDFLNGPLHFQVPEGYRRFQLNHFSVTWEYEELKKSLEFDFEVLKLGLLAQIQESGQEAVREIVNLRLHPPIEIPPVIPPLLSHDEEMGGPIDGVVGIGEENGFIRVNPNLLNVPSYVNYTQTPGSPIMRPWIEEGEFDFGDTVLVQKSFVQTRYADSIPNYIQLSCTGLGAWNDIISVCPYPGHEPNLGMMGNTYEIINPSLTFTVFDDNLMMINNVTLVVQFTLL